MIKYHHSHIGHALFITGVFLILMSSTIIAPLNTYKTKAFGVSDIIESSNNAREQLNVDPLISDTNLMNAAQMKAEDMAKGHYFAHTAPDGTLPWDYFSKVGYTYEIAGENLAITNQDATSVINGWLNSPAHRENLLNSNYNNTGIGMAEFGEYEGHKNTYVIVALYGKRASGPQLITATTIPAGATSVFESKFSFPSPLSVIALATMLMIIGLLFELKHIRNLHHSHHLTS